MSTPNPFALKFVANAPFKDEGKAYPCIETGKDHTRHVFDLGLGQRREVEVRSTYVSLKGNTITSVLMRWLEI